MLNVEENKTDRFQGLDYFRVLNTWPHGNVAVWPSWLQIKFSRGNMAANFRTLYFMSIIKFGKNKKMLKCSSYWAAHTCKFFTGFQGGHKGHKGVLLRVVIRLGYTGQVFLVLGGCGHAATVGVDRNFSCGHMATWPHGHLFKSLKQSIPYLYRK